MESALTIAPPVSRAIFSASADLPLAVGPAIRTAFFKGSTGAAAPESSMPFIATLIANPARPVLTRALADRASAALGASHIDWLAEDLAADLILPAGADAAEALSLAREAVSDEAVDVAVLDSANRRKKLLIADMDS